MLLKGVCACVLLCVEEVVAFVTNSDRFFKALYNHLPARAGMTHQPATASAVVPSVKLTQEKVYVKTLKFLQRGLIESRTGNHSRSTSYHTSLFTPHLTQTLCLSHHSESLPLADHADVLFVVWDPVLALRGFLRRGERCGQLPDPLRTGASITGGCVHGCAA